MDISIIITTCNRADFLADTLKSIGELEIPSQSTVELLVVDNASTDNTAPMVKSFSLPNMPLRYIYEEKRGQSNARNTGMAAAIGEIFLWTDDDIRLPKDWISAMCTPIHLGKADGVAGRIKLAPHLDRDWMSAIHYGRLADTRCMPEQLGLMIGANMAFSRRVLQLVPAFDPSLGPGALGFADDTLFSYQMVEAGLKILTIPTTVEHHLDSSRLLRTSWLNNGDRNGKSAAYAYHHWYHSTISLAKAKLATKKTLLLCYRFFNLAKTRKEFGCTPRELLLVDAISFLDYFINERRNPRNYTLKGLTKIRNK
jgi:glycosyltransferase involved in cell wall biosynthesis